MDKSVKQAYFLAVLLKSFAVTLFCFLFSSNAYALTYCAARGNVFSYEYIKAVSINGLTSNSSGQGYNLFASPVFTMATGSNSINLTPGFGYGAYNESWTVFIDLNQDGIFSVDERLLTSSSSKPILGTINIPATAKSDTTRMRVVMQYSTPLTTPCSTFTYGEVEDYSVNINSTTRIDTTTTAGFDRAYDKELVVEAKFYKDNVSYGSANFFIVNDAFTRPITLNVDKNTTIEWSAHVYLDYTPAGVYIPATCSNIVGNKCITSAGSVGEKVIFQQIPIPTPPPPSTIQTTTTGGFDQAYNKKLVVEAKFYKNNVVYGSSNFFAVNDAFTRSIALDVDKNTTIEWSAHIYLDDTPAGVYIPSTCSNVVGNKCITSAGAIGESVIFKAQPPITPPPTTKISTTVTAGFNQVDNKDLVIEAKFTKDGSSYISSNYYYANSQSLSNPVTIEADTNTNIEWSAHIYGDNSPSGIYVPASCSNVVSNKCITGAGTIGQSVIFKDPSSVTPPPPVTPGVDLTLNFEDLFSGLTYKPGPTISLGSNITASTTFSNFYYKTGIPFNSGYFAFIDLTLNFPAPVSSINFKAAGACTNCTQTIKVTADGQPAGSFILNYQVISTVSLTFPTPVTKISFNQNFGMDDLAIDYQ